MRINIYYGGRGLIEDATIYVMDKLTEVLEELRVEVVRYNLYEDKKGINILSNTIKEADGVILATSVEWFGIGGLMQQFLDACWLYGDKGKLNGMRMLPVVVSTTCGERDAQYVLIKAWELLGGVPCEGICAYVKNHVEFETNAAYAFLIEKRAEELYRLISHRQQSFPTSINVVTETVLQGNTLELTPQESEQLSIYVSDDKYVKKQKEDIQELAQMFKGMLGEEKTEEEDTITEEDIEKDRMDAFKKHFHGQAGLKATYCFNIEEEDSHLLLEVKGEKLVCKYVDSEKADVSVKISTEVLQEIFDGKMTLQRAFMSGAVTAKGDFKVLRNFDLLFQF
jgi:putative sterol carrier protein/putative NADPH-quinone reductase